MHADERLVCDPRPLDGPHAPEPTLYDWHLQGDAVLRGGQQRLGEGGARPVDGPSRPIACE